VQRKAQKVYIFRATNAFIWELIRPCWRRSGPVVVSIVELKRRV